jgi:hypothetical protein
MLMIRAAVIARKALIVCFICFDGTARSLSIEISSDSCQFLQFWTYGTDELRSLDQCEEGVSMVLLFITGE